MQKAVYFCRKCPSFSDAINNAYDDAPGVMNTTHRVWTNLMSNNPRLTQEKHVYRRERDESRFTLLMCMVQKTVRE